MQFLTLHGVWRVTLAAVVVSTLAACSDDDPAQPTPTPPPAATPVSYEITLTNLSHEQPLSPVAVVLHSEGSVWGVGEPASEALEVLAEGGDNSDVLALPMVLANASGAGVIGPGMTESITVTINDVDDALLSVVTMLVNTNDGFTGLNGWSTASLAVGDSWQTMLPVYDAGTEGNTEAAGTIPGPADGSGDSPGYLSERDDVDFVAYHRGVVSADDGLPGSVLSSVHRFDNPVVRLTVTRVE
ncbi:spondin domain-containing protein [Aestuariibacter halophilus]|uniref:Spondin domain-containing protein n=1 Tax=Fluctibacter halophilus TaxID=226011 RepID=A0ABS8G9X4_9ALTE|nr:spondin domain-containing protein [Aestuariibacter halophilus]MCC2617208.1 spondin domain-containing protein [Aestuariibacter halophilus]